MKQILLLSLIVLGTACSKVDSNSLANLNSESIPTARCAPMNIGDNINIDASLQTVGFIAQPTFYDNVQLKLNQIPQAFADGRGYLKFYQYLLVGNGAPVPDNTELVFDIVPKSNVMAPLRGRTKLAYSDIQNLGLNEAMIVIELKGRNAILLELALYDENNYHQGSKLGLLPPYIADPDAYETVKRQELGEHAAQAMAYYHPMKNDSRGLGAQHYKDSANSRYCYSGLPTTTD
jgi:hypothetical protein